MATWFSKSRQTLTTSSSSPCPVFCQIPAALLFLLLIFLWSSCTMIMSGSFVHLCFSNYCISAGTQPRVEIPINNGKRDSSVAPPQNVTENTSGDLFAMKVVQQQLRAQRSWLTSPKGDKICSGRGIYVYNLPPKFNTRLMEKCSKLVPWMNYCNFFKNEGMGVPIRKLGERWYHTHQYSLELIFHSRILRHPCRVYNENEGKLFYVPYYGGLDILRHHFMNVSVSIKDSLGNALVQWLEKQQPWKKNNGKDHVFVFGKISWDFRRRRNDPSAWGTSFLEQNQLQNSIKLLIERHPWHINDIGVPHPTHFHPHTDNDILKWQSKIIQSKRGNLITFAGAPRPAQPENIRMLLMKQCNAANNKRRCRILDCNSGGCRRPETIVKLFTESEFCLQPPGDSPTRKSVFDSMVSGCIPVLFDPFTAYYQYPWHLPENHSRYSVFIDQNEVREMKVNVVERLMRVSKKDIESMRRYIVYELLPGLIYGDSSAKFDKFKDAFDVSVNNLLDRVSRL